MADVSTADLLASARYGEAWGRVTEDPPPGSGIARAERLLDRAEACLWLGRYERALEAASEARTASLQAGDRPRTALAYLSMARAERLLGHPSKSSSHLEKGLLEGTPSRGLALGRLLSAEIALDRKDLDAAETAVSEARNVAAASADPFALGLCLVATGKIALARGDLDRARSTVDEALCADPGPEVAWRANALAGEAARRDGSAEEAESRRRQAATALQAIEASLPAPLRESFWRDPDRAAIRLRAGTRAGDTSFSSLLSSPRAREALDAIGRFIDQADDLPRALEAAIEELVRATGAQRGFVLLFEGEGHTALRFARNLPESEQGEETFRLSFGVVERVVRSGRPFRVADAAKHPDIGSHPSVRDLGLRSILAVPVHVGTRIGGLLYVDTSAPGREFTSEDELLMQQVARSLAGPLSASIALHVQSVRMETLQASLLSGLRDLQARYRYGEMVGQSPAMRRVFETLDRVVGLPYPVLVTGETGTGKELVARIVHCNGPRKDRPFVAINCAALPRELLESELFGHVKGAFTGADQNRVGLFQASDGGTLLLDEVGEMPEELQRKLLRVLQEKTFNPVGSRETRKVDVRVIAATNADLDVRVKEGKFRADLLYRLRVLRVDLPPLRERREDIPLLAEHFLERARKETGIAVRSISPEAMRVLTRFAWPGNVREMENAIRFAISFRGDEILAESLPPEVQCAPLLPLDDALLDGIPHGTAAEAVDQLWRLLIGRTLAKVGGNLTQACKELGISRATLWRRMKDLGIETPRAEP